MAQKSGEYVAKNPATGESYITNLQDARTPEQIAKEDDILEESIDYAEKNGQFNKMGWTVQCDVSSSASDAASQAEEYLHRITRPAPPAPIAMPDTSPAQAYANFPGSLPEHTGDEELDRRLNECLRQTVDRGRDMGANSNQIMEQYMMQAVGIRERFDTERRQLEMQQDSLRSRHRTIAEALEAASQQRNTSTPLRTWANYNFEGFGNG
jgi:hypothetical protein